MACDRDQWQMLCPDSAVWLSSLAFHGQSNNVDAGFSFQVIHLCSLRFYRNYWYIYSNRRKTSCIKGIFTDNVYCVYDTCNCLNSELPTKITFQAKWMHLWSMIWLRGVSPWFGFEQSWWRHNGGWTRSRFFDQEPNPCYSKFSSFFLLPFVNKLHWVVY